MDFPVDLPEIRPSAFYGRKNLEVLAIRDIPSDSEDSELSDDEDEGGYKDKKMRFSKQVFFFAEEVLQVPNIFDDTESQDTDNPDQILDDIPLAQLFGLPPNRRFFFPKNDENITWKTSKTERNPQDNVFLGECNLPEDILGLQGSYSLFKFFITDDFISKVVEQTCLYSTQKRPDRPIKTK